VWFAEQREAFMESAGPHLRRGGTVKLLALGRPSWQAEGDVGTEFTLRQQPH
jgi:hypothetical protein